MTKILFFFLPFLLLNTAAFGQELAWSTLLKQIRAQYPNVPQLSTDSLATWLNDPDRSAPILLDVRTPEEYEVSHLAGAIRIDPDTEDYSVLADVPPDTPIVAYCSVGYRSSALVDRLMQNGFTNAANLEGSIFTWANENHPVYRDDHPVKAVHPYNRLWGILLHKELRSYGSDD